MKVNGILYFAPPIKVFAPPIKFKDLAPPITFAEVDIDGPCLPEQFQQRMEGFYLLPSEECAISGHAFASGVLAVTAIDAMARIRFGGRVGERFRKFLDVELTSFSDPCIAARFYDEFRNGLVHEGRLKKGAQFSFKFAQTVQSIEELLVVNPRSLADEVRSALGSYVDLLERNESKRTKLARKLKRDLAVDFAAVLA